MSALSLQDLFPYIWSAMILVGFLATRKPIGEGLLRLKVTRLEAQVATLMQTLNLNPPVDPMDTEARRLAQTGKTSDAIKLVCSQSGMGLREAKDYVESLKSTVN